MATEAAKETVKLLWSCASALSGETHTNKLLKSYYMTNCRKIAKHQLQLPKEQFAVSQMCPRCSSVWRESEFQLKLLPQPAVAKNAKARKLIAKLDEAQATHKKGLLSKKQRQRAKWLRKRVASNVEIRCEFCQHKSLVPLEKPKKKKTPQVEEEVATVLAAEPVVPVAKAKRKKNKNKNKTAGLKIETTPVPALIEVNKKQTPKPLAKAVTTSTTKVVANTATKINKNKSMTTATKPPTIPSKKTISPGAFATPNSGGANLSQSLKAKNKKKSKTKAATPAAVAPKIQSKTQQKNSLLQLAALLKTQATKSTTGNSTQQRLQSLLK